MFTGIIKGQSKINVLKKTDTDMNISVDLSSLKQDLKIGDSISINGVCLTITSLDKNIATFDLMDETLKRTNFGDLKTGMSVNLEPAMTLQDKLDGHVVYGDVDSIGEITSIEHVGESRIYTIKYPAEYAKYFIDKGRITVDGASLTTINTEQDGLFSVALIPHSLRELNISEKQEGDIVNLEYDVYAKLVFKQRRFHD